MRLMLMLLEWPVVLSNPVYKEDFNGKGKSDKVLIILTNTQKNPNYYFYLENRNIDLEKKNSVKFSDELANQKVTNDITKECPKE